MRKIGESPLTSMILGLAGLLMLLTAACQSEAPAPVSAPASAPSAPLVKEQEIKITITEWGFQPATLQLPAGQPVTLIVENTGNLVHDLTVPALKVQVTAKPGETVRSTVTAATAGQYDYECSLPGHKEAGMTGNLIVATGAEAGGAAAQPAAASSHASHAATVASATRGNQELAYRMDGEVKVFDLKAEHVQWEVYPDANVDAYAYNGQVPGPIMRVTEGEKFRLNFVNNLPEGTVVHFHGPSLPNAMDGVPDVTQKVVEPGQSFAYEFIAKPAGTFVYHTHHNSAVQEPKGLYGMFIIEPRGGPRVAYDREVFQVLSEIQGNFVINGKAFPSTEVVEAKVGEKILVRLANLGQMPHPMHLHGHPFKIVATDGYPVPENAQLTKDVVTIGPGERYDLLIELDNPGVWVFHCHILSHVQNRGVEPGGMITVIKVAE